MSRSARKVAGFTNVIIATHYWSPGWATALEEFLRPRAARLRWIGLPLFADGSPAKYRLYRDGALVSAVDLPPIRSNVRYVADVLRTVRWAGRDGDADLFVAGDNLLALAGLWLRRRRRVKTVVLYTLDFVPRRFKNPMLNRVYVAIDRYAMAHCDVIWNGSEAIREARTERDGTRSTAPQLVVPMGASTKRVASNAGRPRARTVAYLGHLLEKQGVQVVIEALPAVRARFPDARLLVIGDGPYRGELESLAKKSGVATAVDFAGFMDDHVAIEEKLLGCAIGVGPYVPDPENYSRFTDLPGKIITYLACGLAVVLTAVPRQAHLVEESGAGSVVEYSPQSVAGAILRFLADPSLLDRARLAALRMASAYDWDEIFERALEGTSRTAPDGNMPPGSS